MEIPSNVVVIYTCGRTDNLNQTNGVENLRKTSKTITNRCNFEVRPHLEITTNPTAHPFNFRIVIPETSSGQAPYLFRR